MSMWITDGTGTVFDRPEFNRLMTDIKSGRIKCLVVRDLSRFGRDYIETGTYLERIFPQIGLRFIAIKEHYDNFDTDGSNESLMIPLQNMINALYSKDISRKVSTALKAQMEQGTFQKRNLPYGYRWNEDHTNMVIDEETAQYVRLMFQWKIEGWSIPTILNELDRLGAPNTELRKRQNGTRKGDGCSCKGWYSSTLYGILSNPHYVGDTVLGRSMKAIYKGINPIMSRTRISGLYSRTHTKRLFPVKTSRRCRTSSKRLLRLARRVCRKPRKSGQRLSTCSRGKSSALIAGRRCTSTANGSTRTSGSAGMPTMNAVPQ